MALEPAEDQVRKEIADPASNQLANVISSLNIGTITSPVSIGNELMLKVDNCPNAKISGISNEVHHHHHYKNSYVSPTTDDQKPEHNFNYKEWSKLSNTYEDQSWMQPFPWDPDLRIDPEDYYVPLTLNDYGRLGLESRETEANLSQLFDCVSEGGQIRAERVLVRGHPGFGKTTLCMKVVYDWSCGKDTFRAMSWNSYLPLFYKLRYLRPNMVLEDELLKLAHSNYSLQHGTEERTREALKALKENLVIILDGYDEVVEENQDQVKNFIIACKEKGSTLFGSASVLVTSRPTDDKHFLKLFQKHYYIRNIPEKETKQFVHKFYKGYTDGFFQFFESYFENNLLSPLIVFMICSMNKEVPSMDLGANKEINVYFNCTKLLSKRCNHKQGFNFSDDEVLRILFELGQLCAEVEDVIFPENILTEHFGPKFKFVICIGIFKPVVHEGKRLYEPIHRSFLDSLVCYYYDTLFEKCSTQMDFEIFFYKTAHKLGIEKLMPPSLIIFFPLNRTPMFLFRKGSHNNLKIEDDMFRVCVDCGYEEIWNDYMCLLTVNIDLSYHELANRLSMLNCNIFFNKKFESCIQAISQGLDVRLESIAFQNAADIVLLDVIYRIFYDTTRIIIHYKDKICDSSYERFYYFLRRLKRFLDHLKHFKGVWIIVETNGDILSSLDDFLETIKKCDHLMNASDKGKEAFIRFNTTLLGSFCEEYMPGIRWKDLKDLNVQFVLCYDDSY